MDLNKAAEQFKEKIQDFINDPTNREKVKETFEEGYNKLKTKISRTNILICGNTGVGKSSLINAFAGKELADVGQGKPVTKGIHEYKVSENLFFYDSQGYEIGDETNFSNIINRIDSSNSSDDYMHLVLYCISVPSARITDYDYKIINQIAQDKKAPLAIILTQIDRASEEDSLAMQEELKKSLVNPNIFEFTTDENLSTQLKCYEKIYAWIYASLDEGRRNAFEKESKRTKEIELQRIEKKYEEGTNCVLQHTGGSGVIGLSPIPFSDAPILVTNQMALLGRLANIWEVSIPSGVISGGVVGSLVSQLGRSVAGNLLKLIPGIGTIAGGMINAGVASAFTYAFGTAANMALKEYTLAKAEGKEIPFEELFSGDFISTVTELFNNYKK